jgi:hypothetical protein
MTTTAGFNYSQNAWLPRLLLIKNLNLTTEEFTYITNNDENVVDIALIFDEDNNLAENKIVAEGLVEFLSSESLNTLNINAAKNLALKQTVKDAISAGVISTAKIIRKVYTALNAITNRYPSLITSVNTYMINPIRAEANTLTNLDAQTMTWKDLFQTWLFELGSFPMVNGQPHLQISDNANIITGNGINNPTVNAFKNLSPVNSLRIKTRDDLRDGFSNAGAIKSEYFTYNVNAFYGTIAEQNMAKIFLGSFSTNCTVISKTSNSANVIFRSDNVSGWESGTRFIKTQSGNVGIIPNKARGTGLNLGGNIAETFQWSEPLSW